MDITALNNPSFKEPGFLDHLRETIFGISRPLACAQIEITSVCAGQCGYCPRQTQRAAWRARHMQPETFAAIWPLLRHSSRAHLQGWGEPLLHPHFFEFQKFAARAGCLTSTTSSGQAMSGEIAEKLANSGMDIIAFSLAGTDEQSNAIRGNVPFDKVTESIRQVRRAIKASNQTQPLEIHLAYLLLADRMEVVADLPRLMDKLEIDMAVVSTLDYIPEAGKKHLAINHREKEKLARADELLRRAAAEAERHDRFIHYSLPGEQRATDGCRENAARNIYIDADGDVSPCVYLNVPGNDPPDKRRIFGNVLKKDAWSIWQMDTFRDFRQKCLSDNADEICENCPKRRERSGAM